MNRIDPKLLALSRFFTLGLPVFLILGPAPTDIALTGTAVLFLAHCALSGDWEWVHAPWVRIALLLWLWLFVVSITAFQKEVAFSRALFWIRFPVFAAALQFWVLDERWLRLFFVAVGVTVAFAAFDTVIQYVYGHDVFGIRPPAGVEYRLTGPMTKLAVGIFMARLCFIALLPALAWAFARPRRVYVWLVVAAALLTVVAITLSGERMALLLTLLGLVLSAAILPRLRLPLAAALVVGSALVLVLVATRPGIFQREVEQTASVVRNLPQSPYGQIWRNALSIASHYPLTGVGGKNFRYVCDIKGIAIPATNAARCATHPHNIYLEWLVDSGAVGLLGFIALVIAWARALYPAARAPDGAFWVAGGAIALVLEVWPFGPTASFFNNWSGAFVWICAGAALAGIRKARPSTAEPSGDPLAARGTSR